MDKKTSSGGNGIKLSLDRLFRLQLFFNLLIEINQIVTYIYFVN